ncbi:hypothetical protein H5A20_00835 [Pectobacterium brasiliense]|uniref:hypothetical protein n=1 Tax=Pectobacterium brasiliense TaxID=180957 RepID=UPI0019694B31|nr:hypothetical protein [Pectobacterium brasiliense]MBN3197250.1 hypothetical protein [Pectobacterium brasiliense]
MIIEILQDSAATFNKNDCVKGVYTEEFETCSIIIFESLNKLLVIHDSTQLDLADIIKETKKIGKIIKVSQITNSNYMVASEDNLYYANFGVETGEYYRSQQSQRHKSRLTKIIKKLNIKIAPSYIKTKNSKLIISSKNILNDNNVDIDSLMTTLNPLPEKEKRKAIIQLNNIFLAPNSQKLPLDLEFNINEYTSSPALLKSREEMKNISLKMQKEGDNDYINLFEKWSPFIF